MFKRIVIIVLFATLVSMVACGPLQLESGTWTYSEFQAYDNACKVDNIIDSDGTFQLKRNEDGTYNITPDDGAGAMTCTQREELISCPSRNAVDWKPKNIPATVKVKVRVDLKTVTGLQATGEQFGEATCEGLLCAVVERTYGMKFPCTFKANFTANLKQ